MPGKTRNVVLLLFMTLMVGARAFAANAVATITGTEQPAAGGWDTGSVTVSFTDSTGRQYTETAAYGQYSTAASVASTLGAMFSRDYVSVGLSAQAGSCSMPASNAITFHLKGTSNFAGPISVTATSSTLASASFHGSALLQPTITVSCNPSSAAYGASITCGAMVSGLASGSIISFSANGNVWATPILTNGSVVANSSTLPAGTSTIKASYTGDSAHSAASGSATVTIQKATPVVNWGAPLAIVTGTALSDVQLNASTSVSGTFSYTPALGSVLPVGRHVLSVVFTPTDTTNYNSQTATTTLNVAQTLDVTRSICTARAVDYRNDADDSDDVEESFCLYYDNQSGIYSHIVVNNDSYSTFSATRGTENIWVYGVGAGGVVTDGSWRLKVASAMGYGPVSEGDTSASAATGAIGQEYTSYTLTGLFAECIAAPERDHLACTWGGYSDAGLGIVLDLMKDPDSGAYDPLVAPAASLSLTSSATSIMGGQPVTITAAISSGATGTVYFYDNGTPIGSALINSSTNTATLTTSSLAAGSRYIFASWPGDSNYSGIVSPYYVQTVKVLTAKMSIASSQQTVIFGQPVTFTIAVPSDLTGTVYFMDNGSYNVIGIGIIDTSTSTATFTTSTLSAGYHSIGAYYPGNLVYQWSQTSYISLVVSQITPTVAVSCPSNQVSGTCVATVSGSATGSVSFTFNGNGDGGLWSDRPLSGGSSSADFGGLPAGTYRVAAYYSGDGDNGPAFSSTTIVIPGTGPQNYYSYTANYENNGNVSSYTDNVMGPWKFGYDPLNRLTGASANPVGGGYSNYSWTYDEFGNRTGQMASSIPSQFVYLDTADTKTMSASYTSGQNHLYYTLSDNNYVNPVYDNAGNITIDGNNQYVYDGEGRICAVQSVDPVTGTFVGAWTGYLYDAAGNRVAKGTLSNVNASNACDITSNGFTPQSGYVVGPSGEQLTEVQWVNGGWNQWIHTNVYAGGKLIATYDGDVNAPRLHFHIDDPLGTRRMQVSDSGALEATYQSLPFGDGYSASIAAGAADPTENHFTGKERDTETGNDYMLARYYNSATGRFLSPDWSAKIQPVPYAKLGDPQTLNLYAYVGNNPMSRTDPTGHFDCKGGADFCFKQNMAAFELHAAGNTNSALHDVSKTLGKFGEHNGVIVQEGVLSKDIVAVTQRSGSGYSITFNSGSAFDINSTAATLAHEGTHVAQQQREDLMHYDRLGLLYEAISGIMTGQSWDRRPSYEYERNSERAAYTNQGYMERYEGVSGQIYAPNQSERQRQGNIEMYSGLSAGHACTDSNTGAMICAP